METTNTKAPRKPRVLKTEAQIAAETAAAAADAALATQKEAREGNLSALNDTVREALAGYFTAERATDKARGALADAEDAQRGALEATYLKLADIAHANSLDDDMCVQVLNTALISHYGPAKVALSVGGVATLRAKLLRAMQPTIRGKIREIVKPWADAWEAETAAIKAEAAAANAAEKAGETRTAVAVPTPLRAKFDNRGNTITQALQVAQGNKGDNKRAAVAGTVYDKPDDVLTWVSEHPRQKRGAQAPTTAPSVTPGTAVAGLTLRQAATARVDAIIATVKALQADYPHALDTIQSVLDALAHVTGDRLVPLVTAPAAAHAAAPAAAPAEPIAGAAELDSAISDEEIALEVIRMRRMRAAAK